MKEQVTFGNKRCQIESLIEGVRVPMTKIQAKYNPNHTCQRKQNVNNKVIKGRLNYKYTSQNKSDKAEQITTKLNPCSESNMLETFWSNCEKW